MEISGLLTEAMLHTELRNTLENASEPKMSQNTHLVKVIVFVHGRLTYKVLSLTVFQTVLKHSFPWFPSNSKPINHGLYSMKSFNLTVISTP